MIMRVLFAAVLAGILAGTVMTGVHLWRVVPLVLKAETFENQGGSAEPAAHHGDEAGKAHAHEVSDKGAGHSHSHSHGDGEAWAPEDGFERSFYTFVSNLIAGVAFALILAAAVMFTGREITLGNGAIWGAIGFVIFSLAPAAGLSPELPGMPAADLAARQIWWWSTVIATALGIGLILLQGNLALKIVGAAVIAAPHVIGAPHPANLESAVPAGLAAEFAALTLASSALFWIVLGLAMGWLMTRQRAASEASA